MPSGENPGPLHPPPGNLARQALPLRVTSQSWFRFHRADHAAIYWGLDPRRPFAYRFDAPNGEFGVLYVGGDEHAAFIETFGHNTGLRRIGTEDLAARRLARIDVARPLRLVDLSGPGLARIGADARLFAGDYSVAQQWALALFRHPAAPDGIYYPSRHDPQRACAALFDRPGIDVSAVDLGTLLDRTHADLLHTLLSTYRFGLGR